MCSTHSLLVQCPPQDPRGVGARQDKEGRGDRAGRGVRAREGPGLRCESGWVGEFGRGLSRDQLQSCPCALSPRRGRKAQCHTAPKPALATDNPQGRAPGHGLLTFCRQRRQEVAKGEKRQRCRRLAVPALPAPLQAVVCGGCHPSPHLRSQPCPGCPGRCGMAGCSAVPGLPKPSPTACLPAG